MTGKTNTGGPAFPQERTLPCGSHEECEGISVRDYFAAKALQGIYSHSGGFSPDWAEGENDVAEVCYQIADAMLKAREA